MEIEIPVGTRCGVILNSEYAWLTHPELIRHCGELASVPMTLPSGRIVTWCCWAHRAVADA